MFSEFRHTWHFASDSHAPYNRNNKKNVDFVLPLTGSSLKGEAALPQNRPNQFLLNQFIRDIVRNKEQELGVWKLEVLVLALSAWYSDLKSFHRSKTRDVGLRPPPLPKFYVPMAYTVLPRWLSGKESTCKCRRRRRCGLDPWVGKTPWRRA